MQALQAQSHQQAQRDRAERGNGDPAQGFMAGAGTHTGFDFRRQVGLQQRPQARTVQHLDRLLLGSAAPVAFHPAFGQQHAALGAGQARSSPSSFTAAVPIR